MDPESGPSGPAPEESSEAPARGGDSFVAELRRRHVIRVALVWSAGVFVVLQAADLVFPALGLPDWTFRLLVISSLLSFPLVLVVAWVFDLTPEGVRRTGEVLGGARVGRTARVSLLVITTVLVLGAMALSYRWARREAGAAAPDRRTVAVLPFESFGRGEETEYFAEGLHEDVLSQLAKIPDLRVISRTSVLQYANTLKTVPEIGRELGAGSILEGSVRQSGDSIRVVMQLLDAAKDQHLWSETYDRPTSDVFQVQSEIATSVGRALEAELSAEQRARMATAPTLNLEAYALFQQGRIRFERRESQDDALEAVRLFQEAVDLDPTFAMAWAALSDARMWLFWNWPVHTDQAAPAADALARAETLAPDAPETRLAEGYFEYRGNGDYGRALEHFQAAAQLAPGDARPLEAMGFVHRRLGDWDQAVDYLAQAFEGNPRSYSLAFDLGQTYARMRRVEEADRYFRIATSLAPDLPTAYEARLRLHLTAVGDTAMVRSLLASYGEELGGRVVAEYQARLAAAGGAWDAAIARTADARPEAAADRAPYYRFTGWLLHAAGRWDAAAVYGDSLQAMAAGFLDAASARTGFSPPEMTAGAHADLGVAYALKDSRMQAIREGATATALLPVERDAFGGPDQLENLVLIYLIVGEYETALDEVERLLAIPSGLSRAGLRVDPRFAAIRDYPRFLSLLDSIPLASGGGGGGP